MLPWTLTPSGGPRLEALRKGKEREEDTMQRSSYLLATMIVASLALMAGFSRPAHAQAVTVGAPQPPTDVRAIGKSGAVFLTWVATSDGPVGYNVYRRNAGDTADKAVLVNATPLTVTFGTDNGTGGAGALAAGKGYLYFVQAIYNDSSGKPTVL